MRVVPCLAVCLSCLALSGCQSTGKTASTQGAPPPPATFGGRPVPAAPTRGALPPGGLTGILAGQVLDGFNRRPPGTYIQIAETGEAGRVPGAPIEVAADGQGYFTIQGLQPGKRYQLTARTRDGGRALAGTVWATPPDAKVVIRVAETAAPAAPVAPPHDPLFPPPSPPAAPPPPRWPAEQPAAPAPRRAAELGPPVKIGDAPPPPAVPPQPQADVHPDRIATEGSLARNDGPTLTIPRQAPAITPSPPWSPPRERTPANPPPSAPVATAPTPVPSCVLTGQTLYNFALHDLSGQPWEFRNHRGRLVLIDFWGTWCLHCLHAIPHLNILQERYGGYGLEVVGIAYEDGTPQERVQKVHRVSQRLSVNYRLLMGSDRAECPVRKQFAVRNWPTLVLLDERGRIVWRGEGSDPQQLRELEVIIRQRLGVR